MKLTKLLILTTLAAILLMSVVIAEDGTTEVNITNSAPTAGTPELNDAVTGDNVMDLTANTTTLISCLGTATDADGFADIQTITGTIWSSNSAYASGDDTTNHYTNSTCDYNNVNGDYNCSFDVLFYADNETWTCNVTATDSALATGSATDAASINNLIAFDIPDNTHIDFGDMAVGVNTSAAAYNITFENQGNVVLDLQIDAWNTTGDSASTQSMNCTTNSIAIADFRYSLTQGLYSSYTSMTQAGYATVDANLAQQTTGTQPTSDNVFLGLKITSGASGKCTGVISLLGILG